MKGRHEIVVESKMLKYRFEIKRNITIIRGDSATGKTTLYDMIEAYENDPDGSGVFVSSDVNVGILQGIHWKEDLKRIKDTKPQYNLKKAQRLVNLDKAFEVDKTKLVENKRVLLIDDICTTGSTFEEMIRELNANGIYDIVCFAATTPYMG